MRPLPIGHENVTYKEHLELRYLRWDYLVKVANPSNTELLSKEKIVKYITRKLYYRYYHEFSFMGMELEDIENIARIYTISYLGLYSIHKDKAKKARYIRKLEKQKGSPPTSKEIEHKENYSLIAFLEQRILECVNIFRQYCKDEVGFSYFAIYFRSSGGEWPTDEELWQNHGKYGWTRLPWAKFNKIKSFFPVIAPGYSIEIDNTIYRLVSPHTSLVHTDEDIGELIDPIIERPKTPEEIISEDEDIRGLDYKKPSLFVKEKIANLLELFYSRTKESQIRILTRLIKWLERRNGFQNEMREEIEQAEDLLLSLKKQRKAYTKRA